MLITATIERTEQIRNARDFAIEEVYLLGDIFRTADWKNLSTLHLNARCEDPRGGVKIIFLLKVFFKNIKLVQKNHPISSCCFLKKCYK